MTKRSMTPEQQLATLAQYEPVRIIWLDSYVPAHSNWREAEHLDEELAEPPVHETVGLWYGIRAMCGIVVQSRGANEGFDKVDSPFGIPLVAVLAVFPLRE